MQIFNKWILAVAVVLSLAVSAKAQEQTQVYHPGQIIKVSVTFDGPDADKISKVAVNLKTSQSPADQPGFSTDLYSQESSSTVPRTFVISLPIPTTQASGDYQISQIRIFVTEPNINLIYSPPGDFTTKTYTIKNPEHFVKPDIKSVH